MIEDLPVVTTPYPALLPEGVVMLDAARPHNAAVARRAAQATEPATIAVFVQHAAHAGRPVAGDLVRIGCAAVVDEVVRERGQLLGLRVRGLARVELLELGVDGAGLLGQVRVVDESTAHDPFIGPQLARLRARLAGSGLVVEPELQAALDALADPGRYADALALALAEVTLEQRLALLTTTRPAARLELLDQLVGERAPEPATELGRVWSVLRGPLSAVPGFSALRGRAHLVDRLALTDPRLRDALDELLRRRPFLVLEGVENLEVEARRESLLELTAALPTLEALHALAGPGDAALEREIAAAIAFLHAAAAREHLAIQRVASGPPN